MEGHGHDEEKDEHVWLSLKNAKVLCAAILGALEEIDPANSAAYESNASAYMEKLNKLDMDYKQAVDGAKYDTLLFGDRFPMRYLIDDYGLKYYAAFAGCSAESEASFETISFLAQKLDELKLPCVLTIEGARHKIAETIVQNTAKKDQKVLTMDSMQSTTYEDVKNGATYLTIMEQNLDVLKEVSELRGKRSWLSSLVKIYASDMTRGPFCGIWISRSLPATTSASSAKTDPAKVRS